MSREHFAVEEVSFYSGNGIPIETQEVCPLSRHRGRYEYLGITSTTLFEKKYQKKSLLPCESEEVRLVTRPDSVRWTDGDIKGHHARSLM